MSNCQSPVIRPGAGCLLHADNSWYFALQIKELRRLASEPVLSPGREFVTDYLLGLQLRMVALLNACCSDRTDQQTWDLRYIVNPALNAQETQKVKVALLCRLEGSTRTAASAYLQSTLSYMQTTMVDYALEPVRSNILSSWLQPFEIKQLVSIRRRCELAPFGNLQIVKAGFLAKERHGHNQMEQRLTVGSVLHIAHFTPHTAAVTELLSYLLNLGEQAALSIRLRSTALTSAEARFLFDQVRLCEDFLAALRAGGNPGITAQMLGEQAQQHRLNTIGVLNRLHETALLMVVELAAAEALSPHAMALAGNCVTSPTGVRMMAQQQVESWFAGGFQAQQLSDARYVEAHRKLDITWQDRTGIPVEARRLPYLFSPEEAVHAFCFPPRYPVAPPEIPYRKNNSLPAPEALPDTGCLLGTCERSGKGRRVYITPEDRKRHMYVIGQTGTGKTTLLQSMILDDINNGDGVCFIDPHGDAFRAILERVPKHRVEDVIALDVTHPGPTLGLNLLEASNPNQRHFIAQELLNIIYRLIAGTYGKNMAEWSMGPIFFQHLRMNTLLTMSNPSDPGTLLELYNIFTVKDYWKRWLPLRDPDPILNSWVNQTLSKIDYLDPKHDVNGLGSYIASKLENFVFDPRLRRVFGQKKSTINLLDIMNQGKILLINLAKGELSDENSRFLGMVILGKLLSALQERVQLPPAKRRPFHLYVDEFQNLATPSFVVMLSEARKFGLSLVLANQFISQITDETIVSAIMGNVGTLVSFRLGHQDAAILKHEFAPYADGLDLVNLPNFEAYCKLLCNNAHLSPFSLHTLRSPRRVSAQAAAALLDITARRYGLPDAEIDKVIERSMIASKETPLVVLPSKKESETRKA